MGRGGKKVSWRGGADGDGLGGVGEIGWGGGVGRGGEGGLVREKGVGCVRRNLGGWDGEEGGKKAARSEGADV